MINRYIGGLLLIVGTCIGGGMLALPLATAAGGFDHAVLLLVGAWLVMTLGAFLVLEVTMWLPKDTNLISMARATLGKWGEWVMWVAYLLLLYALLCAYTAGGGGVLQNLLALIGIHLPSWANAALFVVVLGTVVAYGIHAVDWANRGFLTSKLAVFVLLVILILPAVSHTRLTGGHLSLLASAIMPVITSYGFAIVMPSLRGYFHSNTKALHWVIAMGSLIPLACYILWILVVQGTVPMQNLTHIASSSNAVGGLTRIIGASVQSGVIAVLVHIFTAICVTTSFLGVSFCLTDFIADGIKREKKGKNKALIVGLTFIPSLLIVIYYPGAFIKALSYAGITCIIVLMLMPALMAWGGRYHKKIASGYQVWGGKSLLLLEIVVSICLIVYGFLNI